MELYNANLSPDELYRRALDAYGKGDWDTAISALNQIEAQSDSTPESRSLLADVQLKQRLETVQSPVAAPPPRSGNAMLVLSGLVVLSLVALLGLSLANGQFGQVQFASVAPQAMMGALPTAAPELLPTAEPAIPTGIGTLAVRAASSDQLTVGVENVYVILDASGSMLASIGDQQKIALAHDALGRLVNVLPDGINVALRTYGRQRSADCTDMELVAPMAPINREALIAQVNGIVPVNLSRTPMAASLAAIPTDLAGVRGETLVVLVSDGDETCEADPVAAAGALRAANPNVRVSVVGFDIDATLRDRLARIAEAGGGTYVDAANAEQLSAALEQVINPDFHVVDAAGAEVAGGPVGTEVDLPAGDYRLTIGGLSPLAEEIRVRAGMATLVELQMRNGAMSAKVTFDWAP